MKPDTKHLTQIILAAKKPFTSIRLAGQQPMSWEAEANFARQLLLKNDKLQECDPISIRDAVVNVASIGLSLNPALQQAALVPRDGKCCLDPMFRGLIFLATGDKVISVRADVVRQDDVDSGNFKYTSGTNPTILHNPNPFAKAADRGPIIGAYVVAEIEGSKFPHVTMLGKERLDQIRGMSKTYAKYKKGPWVDHEEEMCKKTVIKVGSKSWGTGNRRMQEAVALSNEADDYREGALEGEATVVKTVDDTQAKALREISRKCKVPVDRIYKLYDVKAIEDLPADKFDECRGRIYRAGAIYALRHAREDGGVVNAYEYGMTHKDMVDLAGEIHSKVKVIWEKVKP